MTHEKRQRQRKREREREKERETEQESYMQLQLFQFYHNLVMSYLVRDPCTFCISIQKDACVLMGRQQNNQNNTVSNCCFAVEQHAWVTCKQQLIIAMETNACFRKAGKRGLLKVY